jgi:hypothetical protein
MNLGNLQRRLVLKEGGGRDEGRIEMTSQGGGGGWDKCETQG